MASASAPTAAAEDVDKAGSVDADLYSRQLYVMGHAAMNRMVASNVLLIGLDGCGVEIAKNVILMGVKSVALFDPRPTAWEDLASQFFLTPADVGRPRAECALEKLRALNQYVRVSRALCKGPGKPL